MGFELSENSQNQADRALIEPQLVLEIDGVPTVYGTGTIYQIVRIGDTDLLIGGFNVGELKSVGDQETLLTFDGTSTQITQQLDIDKGRGASVSSLKVSLVDKDEQITQLISPGQVVTDILARKCKLKLGFAGTSFPFPSDYITIFRGIIDDVQSKAGVITFNLAHPDSKKRVEIFPQIDGALDGSIGSGDTTLTLESVAGILEPITGPDGSIDPAFKSYVQIEDEILQFTGISGLDLTGLVRGELGTTAAAHSDAANVKTFYRLTDDAMTLALKLMLSGWNGTFVDSVNVDSFVVVDGSCITDALFFEGVDVVEEYGLVVGDFVTTVSATNAANNFTLKEILTIEKISTGSYIVIDPDGAPALVTEGSSPATAAFRSQYDTLPSGMRLAGDEVDIAQHDFILRTFLSSFSYDFYLKESIEDAKEFLEQQVYLPAAAFSLPRKSRASVGFHSPPIPSIETKQINDTDVVRASKLNIRRSVNKQFFNTIVYKFEEDTLTDRFLNGTLTVDATSQSQIKLGNKILTVESKGMRTSLLGKSLADAATTRRLNRYKFGAEFLEGVQIKYGKAFDMEVGDLILLDGSNLALSDITKGSRGMDQRFFEVQNKKLDFKTGTVTFTIVDTNFATQNRYGLIGPASKIKTVTSSSQWTIESSFASRFGVNEFKKWENYVTVNEKVGIKVRSADFTTRNGQTNISILNGNLVTVSPALGFTPVAGDIMELCDYDFADITETIKFFYVHMRDGVFGDGGNQYNML